jgi:hypothetical protein
LTSIDRQPFGAPTEQSNQANRQSKKSARMNSEPTKEMNPRLILWILMGSLLGWCIWLAIGTLTSATNDRVPANMVLVKPLIVSVVTVCFLGGWLLALKMRDWRLAREAADDEYLEEE